MLRSYSGKSIAARTLFTPSDPDAVRRRFERIRARALTKLAQETRQAGKAGRRAKQAMSEGMGESSWAGQRASAGPSGPDTQSIPKRPGRRRALSPKEGEGGRQ